MPVSAGITRTPFRNAISHIGDPCTVKVVSARKRELLPAVPSHATRARTPRFLPSQLVPDGTDVGELRPESTSEVVPSPMPRGYITQRFSRKNFDGFVAVPRQMFLLKNIQERHHKKKMFPYGQ